MKNIQISSYVGIALAVIVEIVAFYYVWRGGLSYYDEDNDRMVYWGGLRMVYKNKNLSGKIKFIIMKIIIGFGLSFADTIIGEKLLL